MTAAISSQGEIIIPLQVRQRLRLQPGDQVEFDDNPPVLMARRILPRQNTLEVVNRWRAAAAESLAAHPWEKATTAQILDDLRKNVEVAMI